MFKLAVVILLINFIDVTRSSTFSEHGISYENTLRGVQKLSLNANGKLKPRTLYTSNLEEFRVPYMDEVIARAEELLSSGGLDGALSGDPFANVTEECLNSTKIFLEALVFRQPWAIKMIDSVGKPGSDITSLHLTWLGSWEECISVEGVSMATNVSQGVHVFDGKYCLAIIPVEMSGIKTTVNIGMCYPDTCSDANCWSLTYTLLGLLPTTTPLFPSTILCQDNDKKLSTAAKVTIVICSLFLALMTTATAYDIFIRIFLNKGDSTSKVTPEAPREPSAPTTNETKYGTAHSVGYVIRPGNQVTSEVTSLIAGEDSYQRQMISHHEEDVGRISNGTANGAPNGAANSEAITVLEPAKQTSPYKPGMGGSALLSFSVITNASKILNTDQPSGTLTNVNGVRFISMMWVILGHTYVFSLSYGDNTAEFLAKMYKRFSFQAIENETVAVDTFFVLSGLLVAYLSLREMKKRGSPFKFNWVMFYFHRFWRLTPPYMLFLMLEATTSKYWGDGPVWPKDGFEQDQCKDTWWTNLLYVNNLVRSDKMCMGWSWYLANDMQFYILSPLMLIPLFYHWMIGGLFCMAFILTNFIATGVISAHHELGSNLLFEQPGDDGFEKIYIKPWTRVGPYAVGIFTGYLLYKCDGKLKMPKIVNIAGWIMATAVALLVLYGLYSSDGVPTQGVHLSAFYNATSRTAWGMAVAWVVFACAVGYGGPVNVLLSWKGIIPLSRLTYCAYLVHPCVMYTYYMSRRSPMHFYDLNMIYLFCGNLCLSYAAAFIISLAFESPMMGLEKVLLKRPKHS